MGYYAHTADVDFTIVEDRAAAALAAVNDLLGEAFASIDDALSEYTSFEPSDFVDEPGGFILGEHTDKYLSRTNEILFTLGKFANEGSYVRFVGEDDSLFGFRVVGGELKTETGSYTRRLDDPGCPDRDTRNADNTDPVMS